MIWHTTGFANNPLAQVPDHVTTLFGLVLNPMRGRMEEQRFLAASESREELQAYLAAERVPSYSDEEPGGKVWRRYFMKGGPLMWFNPPGFPMPDDAAACDLDRFGNGIIELRRDGWRRVA